MGWITIAPLLLATLLFALQGVSFLSQKPRTAATLAAGRLTLLLAACGLGAFLLLAGGWLVVSPEYSIIMVQGRFARFGMALLIFALSLAAGMALQVARCSGSGNRPARQTWILLIGALVGLLSILRMPAINVTDPEPLHVFVYDLWWPVLLLWIAVCITEAATVLLDITDRLTRLWAVLFLPFVLANFAIHRAQMGRWYADTESLATWYRILGFTVIGSFGLGTWLFMNSRSGQAQRSKQIQSAVAGLGMAFVGFASAYGWAIKQNMWRWPLRPWFVWMVWAAVIVVLSLPKLIPAVRADLAKIPRILRPRVLPDFLILVVLGLLVAGVADLFHYGALDPVWDLAGLIVVFVLLLELVGGGPLRVMAKRPWLKTIRAAETPVVKSMRSAATGLKNMASAVKTGFLKPTVSGVFKVILALIVLSIIAQIPNRGKTVVQSFQPLGFSDKDDNSKDLGRLISNRVVNTLGLLRQELRPSMLTLSTPGNQKTEIRTLDTGEDTNNLEASVKGDFSVPGVPSLSIPFNWITDQLQAPFNLLLGVRVVHGSVQPNSQGRLLVMASSSGGETWRAPTLRPNPSKASAAEAANPDASAAKGAAKAQNSTAAKASAPPTDAAKSSADSAVAANPPELNATAQEQSGATPPDKAAAASMPATASDNQFAAGTESGVPCSRTFSRVQSKDVSVQIAEIGDEIAYKLAASDPNLAEAGMTTSWQAIPCFRRGLKAWNDYNMGGASADLENAIEMFRQAVAVDQNFSWAHYYLGLALREDFQPGAAVSELRICLQATPNFYRAAKALAETLYFFDDYHATVPAELTGADAGAAGSDSEDANPDLTRQSRVREAKQWLHQMVQAPRWQLPESQRAAAYAGLSRAAEDAAMQSMTPRQFYLAYFYAKRAQQIFARLPSSSVPDPDSRAAEAVLMADVGTLLEYSGDATSSNPIRTDEWQCNWDAVSTFASVSYDWRIQYGMVSYAYAKSAGKYYQRAMAILPQDSEIRCLAATNSFFIRGNHQPMKDLERDARAHIQLASQLADSAGAQPFRKYNSQTWPTPNGANLPVKDWPSSLYYRFALGEYAWAVALAPDSFDALNGYAYTFWRWRMRDWTAKPPDGPDPRIAHLAEKHARDASYLVAANPSRDTQAYIDSTLGEVLLGQGRPYEALEHLEPLVVGTNGKKPWVGDYAAYNEIRWDTALAYICEADDELQEKRISHEDYDAVANAIRLLDKIAELEASRESRPYTAAAHALDARRPSNVCEWASYQPGWQGVQGPHGTAIETVPNPPLFQLNGGRPAYDSSPPCLWEGVDFTVAAASQEKRQRMKVHVWGGGVDQRIGVVQGSRSDHVLLPGKPKDTHDYYFAQLENEQGLPLSFVYPIDTFASGPGECSNNVISLNFVRAAQ